MEKKLHKSESNKMIAGVCGGFAEYLDIDVSIIRIIWALLTLLEGLGIILYLVLAFILPKAEINEEQAKEINISKDKNKRTLGIILIIIGIFLVARRYVPFHINFDLFWPILLIGFGIFVIFKD